MSYDPQYQWASSSHTLACVYQASFRLDVSFLRYCAETIVSPGCPDAIHHIISQVRLCRNSAKNDRLFTVTFKLRTICIVFIQGLGLWCLTPLSTIFLLYHGSQFYWWRKPSFGDSTDCMGGCKSNYHRTTAAPPLQLNIIVH